MSDYGVFEASSTDGHEEEQQQRQAQRDLGRAIEAAREGFGDFLAGATDKDDYTDRLALVMNDLMQKVADSGVMPVPGVMRKVKAALRPEFRQAANEEALEWAENYFQKRGGDKSDDPAQLWKDALGVAAGEFGTNFSAEDYARHSSRKHTAGSWKEVNPRSEGLHPDNAVWKIQGPNGLSGTVIDELKSGTDADWFIFGPNGPILNRKFGEPPLTVDEAKKLVEDHINSGTLASRKHSISVGEMPRTPFQEYPYEIREVINDLVNHFGLDRDDLIEGGTEGILRTIEDMTELMGEEAYNTDLSALYRTVQQHTSSRKQAYFDPNISDDDLLGGLQIAEVLNHDGSNQAKVDELRAEVEARGLTPLKTSRRKQASVSELQAYVESKGVPTTSVGTGFTFPIPTGAEGEVFENRNGDIIAQTLVSGGGGIASLYTKDEVAVVKGWIDATLSSRGAKRKRAGVDSDVNSFVLYLQGIGYRMPKDAGYPGQGGELDDELHSYFKGDRNKIDEVTKFLQEKWDYYAYGIGATRKQAAEPSVETPYGTLVLDSPVIMLDDEDMEDVGTMDLSNPQAILESYADYLDQAPPVTFPEFYRGASRKTASDASYEGWTARIIYDEDDFEYAETTTPSGEQADSIYPMDGSHFEGGELREALEELALEWGDDAYSGAYQYNSSRKTASKCPKCDGMGRETYETDTGSLSTQTCKACGGTGQAKESRRKTALDWSSVQEKVEQSGWDPMYADYIAWALDNGKNVEDTYSFVDYSDLLGLDAEDEQLLKKFIQNTAPKLYGSRKTADLGITASRKQALDIDGSWEEELPGIGYASCTPKAGGGFELYMWSDSKQSEALDIVSTSEEARRIWKEWRGSDTPPAGNAFNTDDNYFLGHVKHAGGTDFATFAQGSSAQEAFNNARAEAKRMYGDDGYTGSIAEKDSFEMASRTPMSEEEARKFIWGGDGFGKFDDKWGPAGCIELDTGGFVFFGIAST